jgi:FtsP/CotA-like multicopper oxidase with cupredoxin domain
MASRPYISRIVSLFFVCFALVTPAFSADSLRPISTNPNHTPAGVLRDGVLTIELEIARGEWHPEAEDGMTLAVYAFGEVGRSLQNPDPLIRVPQGTEISASVHNTLAFRITAHGLSSSSSDAGLRIAPGVVEQAAFKATTPGLHFYWGVEEPRLFFMHFWANDDAVKLAKGLRAALDNTNSAK